MVAGHQTSHLALVVNGTDVSTAAQGVTWADSGNILRPVPIGSAGVEAVPERHQNTVTVNAVLYGVLAEHMVGGPRECWLVDSENGLWCAGQVIGPQDQVTGAPGALVARSVTLTQTGRRWASGTKVVPLNLTAANSESANTTINLTATSAREQAWVALTSSASATVNLEDTDGTPSAATTSVTATSRWVGPLAVDSLGNGAATAVRLGTSGLSGQNRLQGWLLIGQQQQIGGS